MLKIVLLISSCFACQNVYRRVKILCFLCISLWLNIAHGQNRQIDSLLNLIKKDKEDTNKVKHLNDLGWELMYSNPDTSIVLGNQALQMAEKLISSTDKVIVKAGKKGIANTLGNLGFYNYLKADYPKALDYYFRALKMNEELGNKKGTARNLGNIGLIYDYQANYPKALDYYFRALKMYEELGDKIGIANNFCNIGIIYMAQADYPKAMEYYFKALKMAEEIGDKKSIGIYLGNIGIVYMEQSDYNKALDYYLKALKIAEELGNKNFGAGYLSNIGTIYSEQAALSSEANVKEELLKKGLEYFFKAMKMNEALGNKNYIAINLSNIGSIYSDQAQAFSEANEKEKLYAKSLGNYFKALKMNEELGDKDGIANNLGNIGRLYTKTRNFAEAEKYLKQSLALYESIGGLDGTRNFEESLSHLYDTTGRVKLAFEHYKKYIAARDSINSEENQKNQARTEINHEYEKKEALAKAEQDKKDLLAEEEKQKQKLFLWFTICGLAVVVVVSGFIFRSLQINKKKNKIISEQKTLVEHQKKVVEEKQKEILDSIHYAKRIQTALLTTEKYINRNLNKLK